MILNDYGVNVDFVWRDLPNHNRNVTIDEFVVMPNHVHGIIMINEPDVGAGSQPAPAETTKIKRIPLSEIVRQFKTFSARRINESRKTPNVPVWQRNYYEHIIRDYKSLDNIRAYIINNPARWAIDKNNPDRLL